ncbi:glycoside-pentoside-hexuronide (GPH):cation symporter [Agarivorans gilvus]|uniref:MFS transporter n=1 Tax=Agarivorans gilvus TaxID=680279 RepID=A0ABQ1HUN5_9ALTE|nr:glycoside-pentoside-hexuronide (GPH):cation symporter [Agarivorans gilvus]GGA92437.1 MFS transporter [Agarivorans gilvus]
MSSTPLSVKEKVAYGLGDTGCNFVWQTVMLFLAYYYTDVYGLSPVHMGTMFLLVRFIDAITDPLMGAMIDRTRTKHGQYRPYILWLAIPFGIACMFTFYTPDLGSTGKIIYAYASYILLTLVYTAINVPYCAMANALTSDSKERVSLQSYRFALSTAGGLIVALVALPLVELIGQGNEQKGYLGAMAVMGGGAMLLFFYCFANTKEHHTSDLATTERRSVLEDLKLLWANTQWRVLFILNIVLLTGVVLKAASTMYYVNSVMGRADLATMLMVTTMLANIVGAMASGPLLSRFNKIKAYKILIGISGLLSALMFFISPSNIVLIFAAVIILSVIQMSTTPLLWSMMSDVVDYEKSRSGRSLSGMVFSTNLFAIKAGIAIGGAMVGWILAGAGYIGGAEVQSSHTLTWINLLYTFIPGVVFASLVFIMHFYRLDENHLKTTEPQLTEQQNFSSQTV